MKDIDYFKQNAIDKNLCVEYALKWAKIKDKESLFALACVPQSCGYIARSIYEGWGVSIDYIINEFGDYINGKYVVNNLDGVKDATGAMYIKYNGKIDTPLCDITQFIGCEGTYIHIADGSAVTLHISNSSDIKLSLGNCNVRIYLYDESTVDLGDISKDTKVSIAHYGNGKVLWEERGGCVINKKMKHD